MALCFNLGEWGEERERMLLPGQLVTDFKKFSEELCVQFSTLVLLFLLYLSPSLFVSNSGMADFISALSEISKNQMSFFKTALCP